MDSCDKFKKFLRSGSFRRIVSKYQLATTTESPSDATRVPGSGPSASGDSQPEVLYSGRFQDVDQPDYDSDGNPAEEEDYYSPDETDSESEEEEEKVPDVPIGLNESKIEPQLSLGSFLRDWSVQYNISQQALGPLLIRMNELDKTVPVSPRQLLKTPRKKAAIVEIEGGRYWHNGLGN